MNMKMTSQRGAGSAKAIIALLLFAIFIYAALRIVPRFINNYELDDFCQNEARAFSYNQRSETEIRANIMRKIDELKIPVTANQVRLTKNDINGNVRLNIDYTERVEFPGYTFTKDFSVAVDTRRI